jgi:hypothetical protein
MRQIGDIDFNYYQESDIVRTSSQVGSAKTDKPMNKNNIIAVPVSLIAVAALVLSDSFSVSVESVIGYGSVLALLAMAALEYRITWKRLFGRS